MKPYHSQDPRVYASDFKAAFMDAIAEYNGYGSSAFRSKLKVDESTASFMYGFQASRIQAINLF